MSWLKAILLLVELVTGIMKMLRDRKLVEEGEVAGAARAMELTRARLEKALAARSAPPAGGVSDPDPYLRD